MNGSGVGGGTSTQVPLSWTWLLGQVHTGPVELRRHSHSHFFLSHGLGTETHTQTHPHTDTHRHKDTHTDTETHTHTHLSKMCKWKTTVSDFFIIKTHRHTLTLRLFVAVEEDDVSGVVDACGQVLHGALAKLVHSEDKVVDVGHAVDVVLKHVNAERVQEIWERPGGDNVTEELITAPQYLLFTQTVQHLQDGVQI